MHVPFHDKTAIITALRHGKALGVDCVILNGDLCDFYAVSFWERDPRLRDLGREVKLCREFLKVLRENFKKERIIFKEGNHEERLWRYVWARCPELAGIEEDDGTQVVSLENVLHLRDLGIELVDNKKPLLAGKHLYILHGHEFRAPFVNPVNPARGLYLRAKANAICGDLHQSSSHTESGIGSTVSCWSTGCLSQLHPRYAPLNKWNLGFATIELSGAAWSVENKKIIAGNVV